MNRRYGDTRIVHVWQSDKMLEAGRYTDNSLVYLIELGINKNVYCCKKKK